MMCKTAIHAFTIIEALISMAVTAIVLAILFVLFTITSERLMDFKRQNEFISDLNRMNYALNKAIFENDTMYLQNSEELLFRDYYGGMTTFHISEDYFIREQGTYLDTFHLPTGSIFIEALESPDKGAKFQRLRWRLSVDGKQVDMAFYKKVYATKF